MQGMPVGQPRKYIKRPKKLQVYVSQSLHRWLRVGAAKQGVTLTRFVSDLLLQIAEKDEEYHQLKEAQNGQRRVEPSAP